MLCVGVPSAAFAVQINPETETWSMSVYVNRGAEHTFWITDLSPNTDIYWFEAKAAYKDATGNEAWLEVSKSVTVENDEGIITGMYLLLTAEDWADITNSMLSFAITVYGFYDEDAPLADRRFTFGHAAGRDKFPLEGSDKSRLKLTLGEQLVFNTSSNLIVSNHIVSVPGPVALHAMEKAVFTPSAEVAAMFGGNEEAKAEYCAKFGFTVLPTSGDQWAVVAGLKMEAWSNVVKSAQAATRQIPVTDIAALELGVPTDVTVEGCVPGFYYTIYGGAAVTNLKAFVSEKSRNVLCGTDGKVTFSEVVKPSDASGFFSIGARATPGVTDANEGIAKIGGIDARIFGNTAGMSSNNVFVGEWVNCDESNIKRMSGDYMRLVLDWGLSGIVLDEENTNIKVGEDGEVSVVINNVEVGLWYGIGRAESPMGPYVVDEWVRATSASPLTLTVRKMGDSGFYKIMTRE